MDYQRFLRRALIAAAASALLITPDASAARGEKVPVCHVGHKEPAYDPTCLEGCGDAGKVDLLFLPPKAAEKHLNQSYPHDQDYGPDDFTGGVPTPTFEGKEDTTDDGIYVDDGCVIPEEPEEIIYAVAYIDEVDDDGPYDPDADVLIAKIIENSGDSGPGTGDLLVLGKFPTTWDGTGTTGWPATLNQYEIERCIEYTGQSLECRYDWGYRIRFDRGIFSGYTQESLQTDEGDWQGPLRYNWLLDYYTEDAEDQLCCVIGYGQSKPAEGDDAFIDVEIRN